MRSVSGTGPLRHLQRLGQGAATFLHQRLAHKALLNARALLSGKLAQSACSLIYLMLAARALGPHDFGVLILIHAFTLGMAELVNCQSWQAVVQYGAVALQKGDGPRMQRLLSFSILVDLIGAVVAAGLILVAMPSLGALFGITPEILPIAQVYGLAVIPLIFSSSSLGVLRLFQRFDQLAWLMVVPALIRLIGTLPLFLAGAGLVAFLWLWLLSTVAARVAQTVLAWRELRRNGLRTGWPNPMLIVRVPEPGIWSFVVNTNIGSTLGLVSAQIGMFAVAFVMGPVGAGLYRVAQQFANVLVKPNTKLLIPALYPEIARLTAHGETESRNRMLRSVIGLVGVAAVIVFAALAAFGDTLIVALFGAPFLPAFVPMLWLCAAGLVGALGTPLEPMLVAVGKVRVTVLARLGATAGYALCLYLLLPMHGLAGAGAAALLHAVVLSLGFYLFARSDLARTPAGSMGLP